MKKYIISLLIFSLISFYLGYIINHLLFKKTIQQIENTNTVLINNNIDLQNEIQNLKRRIEKDKNMQIEKTYKNPIDKEEAYCINKSNNSSDMRNCIYDASDAWDKEINKYLKLLKNSTIPEQYKIIENSQNLWITQKEKDNQIVDKFIYNHGGTMYFDIAAGEYKDIIKNRALFLKNLYLVHTDRY